jgi:hypothetical protein
VSRGSIDKGIFLHLDKNDPNDSGASLILIELYMTVDKVGLIFGTVIKLKSDEHYFNKTFPSENDVANEKKNTISDDEKDVFRSCQADFFSRSCVMKF